MNAQSQRILEKLQTTNGRVSMPELSRIGSGKENGFCASFTRRISDLREAGHVIMMTEEKDGKQRSTFYQLYGKPAVSNQSN